MVSCKDSPLTPQKDPKPTQIANRRSEKKEEEEEEEENGVEWEK